MPSTRVKPFATKYDLYWTIFSIALLFKFYIHVVLTALQPFGACTSSQTLFSKK